MKRNLIIITIAALIATACSTNTQTAGNYVDDLYYWPGDDVTQISNEELAELEQNSKPDDNIVIISELGKDKKGSKTLDNYIYAEEEPDWYNEVQAYNLSNTQGEGQDTIFIPDENNGEYVVNNYYINDQMSYADRIRRFHDPYYYDPHVSFSFNWGWGSPYYSSYHRWNTWHYDPWYYDPWGYSSWGYSSWGYSPYYSSSWYYNRWHSPYYYSHYRPYGYYGSYYGNYYPRYYVDNKDYEKSNRRSRRPNTTYSGGGVAGGRSTAGDYRNDETMNKSVRTSGRRSVVNGSDSELAQKSASTATRSERAVVMEKRRSTPSARPANVSSEAKTGSSRTNNVITTPRRNVRSTYSSASTGSTTSSRNYTPSYNKPRTNTRATYNRSNNRSSQSVNTRSSGSRSSYSIPSTERSSKSATYRTRTKTPTKSYSSGTRSTPTRSKSYSSGSSSQSRSNYSSGSSSRSSRSSYSSGSSSRSTRSSSYSSGSSSRSSGSSSSRSGSSSSGRRR
ncbi:MAG: hypothetical protein K9G70_01045 [Prolixibacteraceae bacterium]|nr:hypothetical protein [Prolixibacteraceae bacterium]